jgi:hypothetical protein
MGRLVFVPVERVKFAVAIDPLLRVFVLRPLKRQV